MSSAAAILGAIEMLDVVVEIYGAAEAYEIEFVDGDGRTIHLGAFRADQVRRIWSLREQRRRRDHGDHGDHGDHEEL